MNTSNLIGVILSKMVNLKFFHRCLIKCIETTSILIYAALLILRQRANLEGETFVFEVQELVITHTLLSDNFFGGKFHPLTTLQ